MARSKSLHTQARRRYNPMSQTLRHRTLPILAIQPPPLPGDHGGQTCAYFNASYIGVPTCSETVVGNLDFRGFRIGLGPWSGRYRAVHATILTAPIALSDVHARLSSPRIPESTVEKEAAVCINDRYERFGKLPGWFLSTADRAFLPSPLLILHYALLKKRPFDGGWRQSTKKSEGKEAETV